MFVFWNFSIKEAEELNLEKDYFACLSKTFTCKELVQLGISLTVNLCRQNSPWSHRVAEGTEKMYASNPL